MEIFKINDKIIEYELQRKKIKNSYITIKNGTVIVKVPLKMTEIQIYDLIEKKSEWIIKNVNEQKKYIKHPKKYVEGEVFKVLGKDVVLHINFQKIDKPKLKFYSNKFYVNLPKKYEENYTNYVQELIENFYSKLAEKEIEKAMRKMVMKIGIAPNEYKVKNLKSTWGNCSNKGKISISKNVVMYSRSAIEYVCLHELCHLQYMDHSKKFWALVEKNKPDYKLAEQELKM